MAEGGQSEKSLVEAAIEWLVSKQNSTDECVENDAAIYHLREALRALSLRDSRRPASDNVT